MEKPTARRKGKASCCHYVEHFLNNVEAFHNLEIKAIQNLTIPTKLGTKLLNFNN